MFHTSRSDGHRGLLCMCIYVYICISRNLYTCMCIYTYIYIYMYAHTHTAYACKHICICIYTPVCVHYVHTCICTYTCIHMYIRCVGRSIDGLMNIQFAFCSDCFFLVGFKHLPRAQNSHTSLEPLEREFLLHSAGPCNGWCLKGHIGPYKGHIEV